MTQTHSPADLNAQQTELASQNYDLRITNLARFVHAKIGKIPGKLMDIGAGNGLFLKFFQEKSFEISGIELEQQNVDNMKKDPMLKGVALTQGDITNIQGNAEYDYVICSDVIEHIEDDRKAIHNLFTFVKPGGLLVIAVPAHQFLYGKRDVAWGHFRRYSKQELIEKTSSLNGTLLFSSYWNFLGFFMYFLFEKILKKQIAEEFRYNEKLSSRLLRKVLDFILRIEEKTGFVPIGLTVMVGIKKSS